jgi:p-aminobenzoyl-glutamate transporter AbgT
MTPLAIIAAVYVIGLVAIAHTLGHHPLIGLLWAFGAASAGLLFYVACIILTA